MRRARAVPPAVWALCALFVAVSAQWTILAPAGRSPDEPAHVDLVLWLADGGSYPDYDELSSSRATVDLAFSRSTIGGERRLTPEAAPPRADRETFAELGAGRAAAWPNQMPQHPPLYYYVAATAVRAERALLPELSLEREWHLMRLLGVVLTAPVPLLAWASARRLGAMQAAATATAAVPVAIPQLTHIAGSANNDALMLVVGGLVAVQVAAVIRGDRRPRTAAVLGVLTGVAMLTKAFAVVLVPWVVAAYLVPGWPTGAHGTGEGRAARTASGLRSSARPLVAFGVPFALIGGFWPVRNAIRHGQFFPNLADARVRQPLARFDADYGHYLADYATGMVRWFWGGLGWFEVDVAVASAWAATAAVALAVGAALRRPGGTPWPGPSRARVALFGSVFPLLLAMLFVLDLDRWRFRGIHAFMAGRYLYVAVVPLFVLVGIGAARLLGRRAALAVLAVALVLQADAVRTALSTWWAEPDASPVRAYGAVLSWSPWPVGASLASTAAVVAAAGASAALVAVAGRGAAPGAGRGLDSAPR